MPLEEDGLSKDGILAKNGHIHFRWKGEAIPVKNVRGRWTSRDGLSVIQHFSVSGPKAETYELSFNPRSVVWELRTAWT